MCVSPQNDRPACDNQTKATAKEPDKSSLLFLSDQPCAAVTGRPAADSWSTAKGAGEKQGPCSDFAEWQRPDDTQPQWQGLG